MIKIRSIMSKNVITISKSSSITEGAKLMVSKSVSSLVVVEQNKPIAIVSENDVIQGIISKKTKISDIMSREFLVISPAARFSKVSNYLKEKKFKRFPVMENDELIGLITETDIIQATRDFTRFHEIVQEVILTLFGLATTFFLFYFSPIGAAIFG